MARRNLVLPKRVMILGHSFKIETKKFDDEATFGETCGTSQTITIDIDKHVSQKQLDSTLLHEIVHGILGVSGHSQMLSEQQEEALVVCLENGLGPIISLTIN